MATTITLGSYYTWDNANFTWDAEQSAREFDSFAPYIYTAAGAESLSLTDGMCSMPGKSLKGAIAITDSRPAWKLYDAISEHIGLHETYWDYISFILRVLESTHVIESSHRELNIPKHEKASITGKSHAAVTETSHEAFASGDFGFSSFVQKKKESTNVNDNRNGEITKSLKDKASLRDCITASAVKVSSEKIAVFDLLVRAAAFFREQGETLTIEPAEDKRFTSNKADKVHVGEQHIVDMLENIYDVISVSDLASHRAQTFRTFDEIAKISETMLRNLSSLYGEDIATDDRFLRALNGIIEEIMLKKGGITAEDFQQIVNQPIGYERFIPYIVGEYEYQKALVRLAVTPGSLGAEPAVYNVAVHVDIDDTVDRGTTIITDTSAATTVHFSKHYYTMPEVTVTLRGGNTADGIITPNVMEIDKDDDGYYFKVELLKSDGTRATGTVTWQSVGY